MSNLLENRKEPKNPKTLGNSIENMMTVYKHPCIVVCVDWCVGAVAESLF